MYQISLVHVLSDVDDRFALIPLQLYKRFGPLRAHFSLLGYKFGRVLGYICFGLPKLLCIKFAQVVLQQMNFGLSPFFMVLWAISGPQLLFLEEVPSSARGYLLVSFPIQGRMGHYRAPTLQFILHFSFGEVEK